ncbi:hypothetical protein EKO04_011262 [Ascochyta lentis]|uniref:Uncharacterized protein n=1 Tax=Ascochyta lentis TaxID=205686 RepID=A0A8H7IUS9_9PLEO|nr:hypothetical protein EKO04_011262 [Ascochyta lentis]
MTQIHPRKRGIPALAYPESSPASPCSCSLLFKHSLARAQATLSLQLVISISGYTEPQAITLPYDASALLPSSLGPATIPLPQARLDEIARHGNPQIRTVFLCLKTPCPVWCPPGSGSLRPGRGAENMMEQLAHLAKSTDVRVVFDMNWLRRQHHEILIRLVERPETLVAFATRRRDGDRCMDWTVFDLSPVESAKVVESGSETEHEAPPSYVESHKRPRHNETPSTPSSAERDRKRILLSSARIPTSPTEKASSVSPSARPPNSHVASTILQREVDKAVATLLPGVVERVLPNVLSELRAVPTSPSPSAAVSVSSQTSIPPPPLSTLNPFFNSHIARRVESQLHSIYDHTLSHASYLRNTADAELFELLEDYKADLQMVRDDALAELNHEVVHKFERFREDAVNTVDEVGELVSERADEVCDDVKERLDGLRAKGKESLKRERANLEREKMWLAWGREVLDRDRREFEKLTAQVGHREVRAGSAPP